MLGSRKRRHDKEKKRNKTGEERRRGEIAQTGLRVGNLSKEVREIEEN